MIVITCTCTVKRVPPPYGLQYLPNKKNMKIGQNMLETTAKNTTLTERPSIQAHSNFVESNFRFGYPILTKNSLGSKNFEKKLLGFNSLNQSCNNEKYCYVSLPSFSCF